MKDIIEQIDKLMVIVQRTNPVSDASQRQRDLLVQAIKHHVEAECIKMLGTDDKTPTFIQLVIDEDTFKKEENGSEFTDADLVSFGKEANDIASHWLGYEGWRAVRDGRFVFDPDETATGY